MYEEIFFNRHLLCTNILRTIMFYPACFGLCFTRHILGYVDILFFAYLLKLLLMLPHYSVGILLGMCPSALFKNAFFFSRTIDYLCL